MRSKLLKSRRSYTTSGGLADNSLVFGPGGQASIVAPQSIDDGPGIVTQSQGQSSSQDDPLDQPPVKVISSLQPQSQQTAAPSMSQVASGSTASTSEVTSTTTNTQPLTSASLAPTTSSGKTAASSISTVPGTSSSPAPTSTMSLTTTVTSSSSSPNATSTSTVSAASSSDSAQKARLHAGIAFGAIAGIAIVVALLAWRRRIWRRSRRQFLENSAIWPWDKDSADGVGRDRCRLEKGVHQVNTTTLWEPAPTKPTLPAFNALSPLQDVALEDSHPYPLVPAPVHLGNPAGAYPTVQLCSANSSVPDLAPALGTLQVANLMPGDLSSESSDEASRAGSALGIASMSHSLSSECGTPYYPMASERPRFLGLHGSGLTVPWLADPSRPPSSARYHSGSADTASEKDLGPLPYPGDRPTQTASGQGGWAASIKSNIVNAFNAVVKTNPADSSDDCLTFPPNRTGPQWRTAHREVTNSGIGVLSRASTVRSVHSDVKEWRQDEVDNPTGADPIHVHFPDNSADLGPHTLGTLPGNVQRPPAAVINAGAFSSGEQKTGAADNSLYPTPSTSHFTPIPRSGSDPPQLPEITTILRTPIERSVSSTDQGRHNNSKSYRYAARQKTRRLRRPSMVSPASSYCSVGSDMSRQSSKSSQRLTDAEQFAKRLLRERRKRVMEMNIGRKQSRKQTLGGGEFLEATSA